MLELLDRAPTESPIERDLLAALLVGARYQLAPAAAPAMCQLGRWTLTAQRHIARWRLDLALECELGKVCVEADGHQFHERTPEQAERDRRRDRALTAAGWTVLRFTGREIWRDPDACAAEVLDQLARLEERD